MTDNNKAAQPAETPLLVTVRQVLFQEVQIGGGREDPEMALRAYVHGELEPQGYQQVHSGIGQQCTLQGLTCTLKSLDGKIKNKSDLPKVNFQFEADESNFHPLIRLIGQTTPLKVPQIELPLSVQIELPVPAAAEAPPPPPLKKIAPDTAIEKLPLSQTARRILMCTKSFNTGKYPETLGDVQVMFSGHHFFGMTPKTYIEIVNFLTSQGYTDSDIELLSHPPTEDEWLVEQISDGFLATFEKAKDSVMTMRGLATGIFLEQKLLLSQGFSAADLDFLADLDWINYLFDGDSPDRLLRNFDYDELMKVIKPAYKVLKCPMPDAQKKALEAMRVKTVGQMEKVQLRIIKELKLRDLDPQPIVDVLNILDDSRGSK